MCGDTLGSVRVGCGGEIDRAAGSSLLLEELEEFAVVGQVSDIEPDGSSDVLFQGGFALKKPGGEFECGGRAMAGDGQGGVVEGI